MNSTVAQIKYFGLWSGNGMSRVQSGGLVLGLAGLREAQWTVSCSGHMVLKMREKASFQKYIGNYFDEQNK